MSPDPVIRTTAAAILVLAFGGCIAVVAHGFWVDANYQIPPIVSWVLGAGITSALTMLGVHLGATGAQASVTTGARLVNGAHAAADHPAPEPVTKEAA